MRRQAVVIAISLVGYLLLVFSGYLLFPDLREATKKVLTQAGLVVLFIASLNAGLAFVWASKARHNARMAEMSASGATARLALLQVQALQLNQPFAAQIAAANQEIAEANNQLVLANSLPTVYERAGAISLVLLAVGTAFCFVGAG